MPTPHSDEQLMPDEPKGGWMTSPTLRDADILQLLLCRFTGDKPVMSGHDDNVCQARALAIHPNVDCLTLYYSLDALQRGEVTFELPAPVVTGQPGGDLTFVNPIDESGEDDDADTA